MTALSQTENRINVLQPTLEFAYPEQEEFTELCYATMRGLSAKLFDGAAPILPVMVTTTSPYGGAIGTCHNPVGRASRIWLKQAEVLDGEWVKVLLHEMIHARLSWDRTPTDHNKKPWCAEIERISRLFGREIQAKPVTPRKVDGHSVRIVKPGHLTQREIGRWPHEGVDISAQEIINAAAL